MNGSEFFDMGPYGAYIWSAYAIAAVVLVLNVVLPLQRRKIVHRQLREYYRSKTGQP